MTVVTMHILIYNIKKSAGNCDEDSKCYMSTGHAVKSS